MDGGGGRGGGAVGGHGGRGLLEDEDIWAKLFIQRGSVRSGDMCVRGKGHVECGWSEETAGARMHACGIAGLREVDR